MSFTTKRRIASVSLRSNTAPLPRVAETDRAPRLPRPLLSVLLVVGDVTAISADPFRRSRAVTAAEDGESVRLDELPPEIERLSSTAWMLRAMKSLEVVRFFRSPFWLAPHSPLA